MARNQSKNRLFYIGKSPSSAPNVRQRDSQGQSQAPVESIASNLGQLGHGLMGRLAAVRSRFGRSHGGPSSSSANPITSEGAQEDPEPPQVVQDDDNQGLLNKAEPEPDPASAGDDLDVAQQVFESIEAVPRGGEIVVKTVARAGAAFADLQNLNDTYLKPLKVFNSVVATVANVHPYAQIASGILIAASQLIITQANLDNAVSELLKKVVSVYAFLSEDDAIKNVDSMRVPLAKIARAISAGAQFIKDYSGTRNFWRRLGKNIISETQTAISDYTKTLDELMQQYRDCQTRDIQINIYRVLEDLSMEGMAYAGGAGLNTMKKCLENTRTEILRDIINWVNDPSPSAPCILWLHGQAGRGKSAIAHTVASWLKDMGGLGSCFCFARDRQVERREEKMLTSIARDLAGQYPAFRRALGHILAEDHTLKTTSDLLLQWQKLILEPLGKATGAIVGNVVVVIDALDESGPDSSRRHILSLLTSTEAATLPKLRILLTFRPLPDIERALRSAEHVKAMCLDDVPAELTQRDVTLFVSKALVDLKDVAPTEIQQIVHKSNGLFEWARLACEFINPNTFGQTVEERLKSLIAMPSDDSKTLLDSMYATILESVVPKSGTPFLRFCSVMQQLLMTFEPLPMTALNVMRSCFPDENDRYDVVIILQFMAPVLSGIADNALPVRPLHASFYDFLTDHSRSGAYFVDISDSSDLAYASLQLLRMELRFNICGLESSYLSNSQIPDLPERIKKNISGHLSYSCKFWAKHLAMAKFDISLATSLQAIMENERVLFWLEILSLLGALGSAEVSFATVARWLQGHAGYEVILALAMDGVKFIQNCTTGISCSTPHLYLSALPFAPSSSLLSRMLMPKFSHLVQVQGGLQDWPAAQLALHGHTGPVTSVAFSHDGNRIVSGSWDQTVRVWDANSGVQIGSPLEGHGGGPVTSVAFSPDGNRIVSGSWDQTVRVWDANSGVQIGSLLEGHGEWVISVAFSPDGNRIVSGSYDKTVRVWDAKNRVQVDSPQGQTQHVTSVASSPDGNRNSGNTVGIPGDVNEVPAIPRATNAVQVYGIHPICFSSVSSHALPDSEQLLDGPIEGNTQPVQLHHDGWIRGLQGRLLLWIPTSLQCPFYSMSTTLIIPSGCCVELDLSKMVHGNQWQECFKYNA